MRKILGRFLAVIGATALILVLAIASMVVFGRTTKKPVASNTVLELDLRAGLVEFTPEHPLAALLEKDKPSLRGLVEGLEAAATDNRVKGLIARVGASPLMPAQVQELHQAVLDFRKQGKFAVAWADSFNFGMSGLASYCVASAFDEILIQPNGFFGVNGFELEQPMLRGALDKLGVQPRFEGRKEYKSAVEPFMNRRMSDPAREALQQTASALFDQCVERIAAGRKLTPAEVREAIDKGGLLAEQAKERKLVDAFAYRDEAYEKAKSRAGKDAKLLYLGRYRQRVDPPHREGARVALIYAVGAIVTGAGGFDPLSGDHSMGADTVSKALRLAAEDKDVKAILLRVDSPGGSVVASETIWREVVNAKKKGKPVIVSMGALAASGGYYISMHADKIVAQPGTITGSIGVLSGKMITKGFWDKTGVNWDGVKAGENADIWNGNADFTPAQLQFFRDMLDTIYESFTSKVAEGRNLPKEQVLEIAKGRIWSGADAKRLGLVDELGGLETALKVAKQSAGIKDTDSVELRVYPPPKGRLETIMTLLRGSENENSDSAEVQAALDLQSLRPLRQALSGAGALNQPAGELSMTPLVWK